MFQTYAISWMIGREGPHEDRDRMHRLAIREAAIATEDRQSLAVTSSSSAPARRLAFAAGGTGQKVGIAACCA